MSNPSTSVATGKSKSDRKSKHSKCDSTGHETSVDKRLTGVYGAGNVTHLTNKIFKLGEDGSGTRQLRKLQDFDSLKKRYLRKGILFKDREFPARGSSVFPTQMPKKYKGKLQWMRPGELVADPKFFVEGPSAFDVRQGKLGDCWFLAGVANLAQHRNLLSRVAPQSQNNRKESDDSDETDCECRVFDKEHYAGIFHFRFWHFGSWVDVVIDDRLPTFKRKLIFSKSFQKNEFWCALLEKAYAKLHGSYEILRGGKNAKGLEDLTGGICVQYRLDDQKSKLMEALIEAQGKNALIGFTSLMPSAKYIKVAIMHEKGLSIKKSRTDLQKIVFLLLEKSSNQRKNSTGSFNTTASCEGIVQKHTYSMTKFLGEHEEQLLKLRNPWGKGTWTGKWSDGWVAENIPEGECHQLESGTPINGEFFISFESVKSHFKYGNICYFNPVSSTDNDSCSDAEKWKVSAFEGEWISGKTAGGRYIAKDTSKFWSNPQYRITLKRPSKAVSKCEVIVGLTQNTLRSCHGNNLHIGFYIFSLKDPESPRKVHSHKPKKHHTTGSHLRLAPGTYRIIPATRMPDQTGKFLLRVFSKGTNVMEEYIPPADCNNEIEKLPSDKRLPEAEDVHSGVDETEGGGSSSITSS